MVLDFEDTHTQSGKPAVNLHSLLSGQRENLLRKLGSKHPQTHANFCPLPRTVFQVEKE